MRPFRPIAGLIPFDNFSAVVYVAYCAAIMPGSVRAETFTVTIAPPSSPAFAVKVQPAAAPTPSAAVQNAPGTAIPPAQPMQLWRMYDAWGNTWEEWRAVPPQVMPPPGVAAPPFPAGVGAVQPWVAAGNPGTLPAGRVLATGSGVPAVPFTTRGTTAPGAGLPKTLSPATLVGARTATAVPTRGVGRFGNTSGCTSLG